MNQTKPNWEELIDDSLIRELKGDKNTINQPRQVHDAHYSFVGTKKTKKPQLIIANRALAATLGFDNHFIDDPQFKSIASGNHTPKAMSPYAMCYGGHQFGNWAGQLGDGRAINLCQINHENQSYTLQLKGAGQTPYSRRADGLAVLRSSIREYLMSEAMHHLGIPTTRALSLCLTGDQVLRDMMYDGNSAYEKGAVVCRVSKSFIRFGNFQIFASRNDLTNLRMLLNYTINHYYPHIKGNDKDRYIQFFQEVSQRTAQLMIEWQRVGFVHGVMNTDNMSILGETIDYGPYGWLDNYDPDWTPNTTDNTHKRYRYSNQPYIAQWNLAQLANALYPVIEESEPLIEILNAYKLMYHLAHTNMMASKLGLDPEQIDHSYVDELGQLLSSEEIDMTIFYRQLSTINHDDTVTTCLKKILPAFYDEKASTTRVAWTAWFTDYLHKLRSTKLSNQQRQVAMKSVNPKYVLRNYMAQMAIDQAENNDYTLIHELYELLKSPYLEQPENQKWFARRPEWARHKIGCSALSCSS